MSTFPMQPAPNHSHFFPSPSPAPSTSHYQFPQYWYNHPPANTSFATPSSSPGKRKRDGTFDEQDSSSSDDGGPDYNPSAHRGSHGNFNSPAQRGAAAAQPPPARPVKRPRREWNNSADDGSTGLGGIRPAGMENGFARMSLFNNRQQTGIPTTFVQEPIPIQRHEQPTKEVHMKTRSWYEPEKDRIVVLDLDGSDSDSETTPPSSSTPSRSSTQSPVDETMTGDGSGYTISQAYLSRIKGVPQGPSPPPNMNPYQAGALILYKNLPNLNGDTVEVVEPLDDSHPNYVLPNWGPIPAHHDRPLYASIEEVDDDEDTQMMDVDGN